MVATDASKKATVDAAAWPHCSNKSDAQYKSTSTLLHIFLMYKIVTVGRPVSSSQQPPAFDESFEELKDPTPPPTPKSNEKKRRRGMKRAVRKAVT